MCCADEYRSLGAGSVLVSIEQAKMKTVDFQAWTVISGDEVKLRAERDICSTLTPGTYDAVLLVSKEAIQPTSVEMKGTVRCHRCSEQFSFACDVLLHGSGGTMLSCPQCDSRSELCHWNTRKVGSSLAKYARRSRDTTWITVTPCAWLKGSPLGASHIEILQVGGAEGKDGGRARQTG